MALTGRATLGSQHELSFDSELLRLAISLDARSVPNWSTAEHRLVERLRPVDEAAIQSATSKIASGQDPLGDLYCAAHDRFARRPSGITLTPNVIVDGMVQWANSSGIEPGTVVDPGTGSGRFLVAAGKVFPNAKLVGIEADPVLAVAARANLAVAGFAHRAEIALADFRAWKHTRSEEPTLFIGNPPYVRHHLIDEHWKNWLTTSATDLGLQASQLAGMHVYFLLATAMMAKPGDVATFITSSEWLDVNYGKLARELFLKTLGGVGLTVVEPTVAAFSDAATTATISYFRVGEKPPSIRVRRVHELAELTNPTNDKEIRRERFEAASRWSHFTRPARDVPEDYIELGELFSVHRGQVTGANKIWIAGDHSKCLPERVLYRSITKAREVISAGETLTDLSVLRRVIDIPDDLSALEPTERAKVLGFLSVAKRMGGDKGYVAEHRKSWWSVGLRKPARIIATYMARRPPSFTLNEAKARHINIAHGLYPRESVTKAFCIALVRYLRESTCISLGRTYAGGLTKFEPREMERIPVPQPKLLLEMTGAS